MQETHRKRYAESEAAFIRKLRAEGKRPHEIAIAVDRSVTAIHRFLSIEKKRGIIFPKIKHASLKYDKQVVEKWRKMAQSGMKQIEIARIERVHPVIVSNKLVQELYGELRF